MFKKIILLSIIVSLMSHHAIAQKREIALTIDDLPFVGEQKGFHLNMIIEAAKQAEIPVTGFVIAGRVTAADWPYLSKFHDAGFGIGNHTLTHLNMNEVDTQTYLHEIEAADKLLAPILTTPKYFRYPYLARGTNKKADDVSHYLQSKAYLVAPVTTDSKDFVFNQLLLSVREKDRRDFLNVLKPCYLDFIWKQTIAIEENNRYSTHPDQPQILLIHANLLNAYVLPDLINLYKQNGFSFVSLQKALDWTLDKKT